MNQLPENLADAANELHNKKSPKTGTQTVLNVIFAAAILGLFLMYFLGRFQQPSTGTNQGTENTNAVAGPRIAYVNSDSIMANYELVKDMRQAFTASTRQKEIELKTKQKVWENKVADFQKRVGANAISMDIAQITEKQLMEEQQSLVSLRDKLTEQLAAEEYELNVQLLDNVTGFLTLYNQEKKYDLVFNYKAGTTIFLANQAMDITNEVLSQLNAEYLSKKPARKR